MAKVRRLVFGLGSLHEARSLKFLAEQGFRGFRV